MGFFVEEPGAEAVEKSLAAGSAIGTVNWAEVLSKAMEAGVAPETLATELEKRGILGNTLDRAAPDHREQHGDCTTSAVDQTLWVIAG